MTALLLLIALTYCIMERDIYNYVVMFDKGFENIVYEDIKKVLGDANVQKNTMKKLSLFIIKDLTFDKIVHLSYFLSSIREGMILLLFSHINDLKNINVIKVPFRAEKIKIKIIKERKYDIDLINYFKNRIKFYGERIDKILIKGYLVDDYLILGIPLIEDYSKRGYKIVELKESLNPVLANLLLKDNWKNSISVINVKDGTIPIEAGIIIKNIPAQFWNKKNFLFPIDINYLIEIDQKSIKEENFKLYAFDSYGKNISIAKKNSINALVKDVVYFKRVDIEYLDLLVKEKFDLIIGDFYKINKKNLKYLIYSSKYLLNERGKLIIISEEKIDKEIEGYCRKYELGSFEVKIYRYMFDKCFVYKITKQDNVL